MATISWDTLIFKDTEQPVVVGTVVYPITRDVRVYPNNRVHFRESTLCFIRGDNGSTMYDAESMLSAFVVSNPGVYDTLELFVSGPADTQGGTVMCYINNGHGVLDCYISVSEFSLGDAQPCYISASLESDSVQMAHIVCDGAADSSVACYVCAGIEIADTQPCFISSYSDQLDDAVLAFVSGGSSVVDSITAYVWGKDTDEGFLLSYVEGS